jgi:hypothetical protein
MARMASGAAAQNFGQTNINYDSLASFKQAGLERRYQADAAKDDRVRSSLKEAEQNRLINNTAQGSIAGLLQSNPSLMTSIDSGDAPKSVQDAFKKYEGGGGNLQSNALLSQFLSTADTGQKQTQALQFEQDRQNQASRTAQLNAIARVEAERNAMAAARAKADAPNALILTADQLNEFENTNSNTDYGVTPMNVGGEVKYQVGARKSPTSPSEETFMTAQQLEALRASTGLAYKMRPYVDPKTGQDGFMVGNSYAPSDTTEDIENAARAKRRGENTADREDTVVSWSQTDKPLAEVNMSKYDSIITGLKTGQIDIGGITEYVPDIGGMRESVRGAMNPSGQDAVDNVRSVVFLSLKAILGGQFSKDEANRLVASTYNPQLRGEAGVTANVKRLEMANLVLKRTYQAKMDELAAYQSGVVYKGPSPAQVARTQIDIMQQTAGDSMFINTGTGNKINSITVTGQK